MTGASPSSKNSRVFNNRDAKMANPQVLFRASGKNSKASPSSKNSRVFLTEMRKWRIHRCYFGHLSRTDFRPLSSRHISKSDFMNGYFSGFCFVFQVIQVISSGEFSSAGEVDLIPMTKPTLTKPPDFKAFFLEKRLFKCFPTNVPIRG